MKRIKKVPPILQIVTALFLLQGICLLFWPEQMIDFFTPILGVVLLLVGIMLVAHSLATWQRLALPLLKLLRGFINILAGLVFLAKNDTSLAFLSALFGLYILVMTCIDLSAATDAWKEKKAFWGLAVDAGFKLILGILLLFSFFTVRTLWVRVLGIYFIIAAINTFRAFWRESPPPD